MLCWSCERDAGDGALCARCGAITSPPKDEDFFLILGLPAEFSVDLRAAEARFRELSRQFHPDKFAQADPRARRASLQRSVRLNEAWRTIKDPERRAEYLLTRLGYDVAGESGASGPGPAGGDGQRVKIPVPASLLGEVLELREGLADARAEKDAVRVRALAADVRHQIEGALREVESGLGRAQPHAESPMTRSQALESAVHALMAIRYFRRFLEEVPPDDEQSRDALARGGAQLPGAAAAEWKGKATDHG